MEHKIKRKSDIPYLPISSPERSEISMHSDGAVDNEHEDKLFSFNQSFNNIEHNNKLIQEKANSFSKIKMLQDQIRSHKSRSSLWERAKTQILNLNKYLKMSAVSLGCSDSAIMKEFFEIVTDLLENKQKQTGVQKSQVSQAKRKEQELFEKLVDTNKKKYELQQKLVQYQHQVTKLSQINESLREKSRAQSTQRSSKIKQFHEETILTIHQKQQQLACLEDRNDELKRSIIRRQNEVDTLKSQLAQKQEELMEKIKEIDRMAFENKSLAKKIDNFKEEQNMNDNQLSQIKSQLNKIVEENIQIRQELTRRGQLIVSLRSIIEEARSVNQQYINQQNSITRSQQLLKMEKLQQLINQQAQIKGSLKSNLRFGINKNKRVRSRRSQQTKGQKTRLTNGHSEQFAL